MAERVGFEPTLEFPLNTLSKRAPSATRPSLQQRQDSNDSKEKPEGSPVEFRSKNLLPHGWGTSNALTNSSPSGHPPSSRLLLVS